MMIFTGRYSDLGGPYDMVKCTECGVERSEIPGVNPKEIKCNNCKGDSDEPSETNR